MKTTFQTDQKLLIRFVEDEGSSRSMPFSQYVEYSSDQWFGEYSEEELVNQKIAFEKDGKFFLRLDQRIHCMLNFGCSVEECVDSAPDLGAEITAHAENLLKFWEETRMDCGGCGGAMETVHYDLGDPENGPKLETDIVCLHCNPNYPEDRNE